MGHPALVINSVKKSFGGVQALKGLSLQISPETILGVIGPNGAGKTTLVNIAGGQARPDSGSIWLWGEDVTCLSSDRRFQLGLGRTFQGLRLYQGLTCYENIVGGGIGKAEGFSAVRRRAEELIELLGLQEYRTSLPANMPFGKQKLVAIARGLSGDPNVLLLDEPFAGLTEEEILGLAGIFRSLVADKKTAILIVEHNLEAISQLAHVLAVLNHGELIAGGDPKGVLELENVKEAYFGGHKKTAVLKMLRHKGDRFVQTESVLKKGDFGEESGKGGEEV